MGYLGSAFAVAVTFSNCKNFSFEEENKNPVIRVVKKKATWSRSRVEFC